MKLYICEDIKNAAWLKKVPSGEKPSLAFAKMCICDYIGRKEGRVEFKFIRNKYGKPFIKKISRKKGGQINRDVFFSLSHSGDVLICAVSRYNIGADCQLINIKDIKTCKKIAGRFYSPQENRFLDGLPEIDYINNFFKIWTKKEAYIKYTGRGLSEGLSTFSVNDLAGVNFKRALPELSGAYIYLCYGEENKDNLEVKYVGFISSN
jgi:phosphopantetheinyl transferase (holo-ACP synthase)